MNYDRSLRQLRAVGRATAKSMWGETETGEKSMTFTVRQEAE